MNISNVKMINNYLHKQPLAMSEYMFIYIE